MEFKIAALFSALVFLIWMLYHEIKRPNRSYLLARIIASVFAIICFVFLVVPISYQATEKKFLNELILLTEGFNPDSVLKLKGKKYALLDGKVKISGVEQITDLPYFVTTNPQFTHFKIFGYGLKKSELKYFTSKKVDYNPINNITGVISCAWSKNLNNTQPLIVQGAYQNQTGEPVKLVLKGFGQHLDSTVINEHSTKTFSLLNHPKQLGKAVYQLISLQDKDTLASEPIPFEVSSSQNMRVMILASFPDFEYKFLKNWLYENHYPVAFRTQISKDKFSSDFLNLERFNINQLNQKILQNFDVVIIDESELASISEFQRKTINDAVRNGLGLFVKLLSSNDTKTHFLKINRYEISDRQNQTIKVKRTEDNFLFSELPPNLMSALKMSNNSKAIITTRKGDVLVSNSVNGEGKLMFATIASTYNWMLAGKKGDYQQFWSTVLNAVARKKEQKLSLQIVPQFPIVNEKIQFVIEEKENKTPQISFEDNLLAPRQNMELPFRWDAMAWPKISGWQNVIVDGLEQHFYIYQKYDWLALQNHQKSMATSALAERSRAKLIKEEANDLIVQKQISLWWLFSGFLLAMGFLWYESRILSMR